MPPLRFYLLGQLQIEMGQAALSGFVSAKAQALLIYLVLSPGRHSRNRLANLLWSEFTDDQARNNLRTTLSNLNSLVGPHLTIERDAISYNHKQPYWLDVDVVRTTFDASLDGKEMHQLEEASALYRGSLLEGFSIRNVPVFEDWLLVQREHFHGLVLRGLSRLADRCIAEGAYESGLAATRRLLTLEPWQEQSHRQQMALLAYSGQRAAALSQYERCRAILAAEFAVEPQEETTLLFHQVRDGTLTSPTQRQSAPQGWLARLRRLTQPASPPPLPDSSAPSSPSIDWDSLPGAPPLVGREAEIDQLTRWLTTEQCRLITLYGLGGQGKSALAASVVRSLVGPSPISGRTPESLPTEAKQAGDNSFQVVLWRSLRHGPRLTDLLQAWLLFFTKGEVVIPAGEDEQLSMLIECLRRWRCLLILDDAEGILHEVNTTGGKVQRYAGYNELFRRIAISSHQSCLLCITDEQFRRMEQLMQSDGSSVRAMRLRPLSSMASQLLLRRQGITAGDSVLTQAARHCAGQPLALLEAAHTARELFSGNMAAYLDANPSVTSSMQSILEDAFARLAPLEVEILSVLAESETPLAWNDLHRSLTSSPGTQELIEAHLLLLRRCLIEKEENGGIGLSALIAGYMREKKIARVDEPASRPQTTEGGPTISPSVAVY